MLDKSLGNIDWTQSAERIERLIRGLCSWPSAYTYLAGKTLKIWRADVVRPEPFPAGVSNADAPGTICYVDKKQFMVVTGDGCLSVREVQLEGKKRMASDAFLRGYRMEAGMHLTRER
jgi:methionyl-tRNA formyltransferase